MRVNGRRVLVCCSVLLLMVGCSSMSESTTEPDANTVETVQLDLPAPVRDTKATVTPLSELETARIDLNSPDWMTVEGESFWVRLDPGTLVRVDPVTAKVDAKVRAAGEGSFANCAGLGSSPGAVWSCSPFGPLQRVDTSTNRTDETLDIEMSTTQGHLVAADSRLWVLTPEGQEMRGVDLDDLSVSDPVDLGVPCTDLTASGTVVWAACPFDNQLVRVDVTTGEVTDRLGLEEPRQLAIGDELWVTFGNGVAQIDPDTFDVEATYDVAVGYGAAVDVGESGAWVRTFDGGPFLTGIDPKAHQITSVVTARDLPSGGNVVEIDGALWATAFDDAALVHLDLPPDGGES